LAFIEFLCTPIFLEGLVAQNKT